MPEFLFTQIGFLQNPFEEIIFTVNSYTKYNFPNL